MNSDQLQQRLKTLREQRELAFVNLHRLDGAIAAVEMLLREFGAPTAETATGDAAREQTAPEMQTEPRADKIT